MLSIITEIFERDLNKLIKELKAYPAEADIWQIPEGVSNSAGNLALHLIGNLNHLIGAALGNTGYVRNRENEFSVKNISANQLIENIRNTLVVIKKTLGHLSDDDLKKQFPFAINNKMSSTHFVLIHLISHLSYHLGQINYHRRMRG